MNYLLRPLIWPSFLASSGVGPCNVPFRYASASILDFRFRILDFLQQFMIENLIVQISPFVLWFSRAFCKISIRNPHPEFRNRRPGGTPILFALAPLRSVPQAGSQFHGLATAIHEISGLGPAAGEDPRQAPRANSEKSLLNP